MKVPCNVYSVFSNGEWLTDFIFEIKSIQEYLDYYGEARMETVIEIYLTKHGYEDVTAFLDKTVMEEIPADEDRDQEISFMKFNIA